MNAHTRPLLATVALALVATGPAAAQTFQDIPWVRGPATGELGAEAQVQVPAGCMFTGKSGIRTFMELTQNPVGGNERGVVFCNHESDADAWFAVFSYAPSGYVRDDERDALDASNILTSIRRGTEAANQARRDRGWETLSIEGWVQEPFYDAATNNLTWSLKAATATGGRTINHSVRILGRGGVMHADLVADPAQLLAALRTFSTIVSGFGYRAGHRYAEWRRGEKIAQYGLTALIAGGAGVAAAKSGLLAKFWKVIVGAVAAAAAGLKSLFRRKGATATARA